MKGRKERKLELKEWEYNVKIIVSRIGYSFISFYITHKPEGIITTFTITKKKLHTSKSRESAS